MCKGVIDQIKSWWNKNIDGQIIKLFINVYNKQMKDDIETNKIIRTIKELFIKNVGNRKELSKLIDKYLIPQELEKKSNAEVSTPYTLRQEMLDKIPLEFWKSPRRVFEPCSGKGGFVIDIIDRFMIGLEDKIPNEKERYRKIVEECLYFSDINPTNIFICTLLINSENEYKLNYNEGNTLELDVQKKWSIDGFDAVIGNPPYQPPSNNKKGGKSIWDEFVKYSIFILVERGLLLFVHPALWRKPGNKMREIMFSKQIHYLSIHNDEEGNKNFGSTTRFDYYLLENNITYKNTIISFEDKKIYEINISKLAFIPNFGILIIKKILNKLNKNEIKIIGDSDCHTMRNYVSKNKSKEYNHLLLNSVSKTKGKTYYYSSRPHKNQNKKKVIFSNGRQIVPFYDDGNLGVTQGGLYIFVTNEKMGKKLITYLESKIIKFIIKATKWSNFETTKQIFDYIPNIINELDVINDDTIYKYFNINQEEINTIESYF